MNYEKRGLSSVVATILLILITIAAAVLIAAFLIPWVKESLPKTNCVDVLGIINIVEDKDYTCYNSELKEARVMIERGFKNVEVKSLIIVLSGASQSKRFEIVNGTKTVDMPGISSGDADIEIPDSGETRTYIFNLQETGIGFAVENAEAALVVGKDTICESVNLNLPSCPAS